MRKKILIVEDERMDGSGYPGGLRGDKILLKARILAVADVVEAMSSYRLYWPAFGIGKALGEVAKQKGCLYDREVVNSLLRLAKEKKISFE